MAGMYDGVSKVWVLRKDSRGLDITGYQSNAEAAVAVLCQHRLTGDFLETLQAHRAQITRMIRNERAQRKRDGR